MITNSREQKICDKYSAEDETGHVHCNECPLKKSHGNYDFRCKGNSHYNHSINDWEYDDDEAQYDVLRIQMKSQTGKCN